MENNFVDDYNLSNLLAVKAQRFNFRLHVTPRFVEHFTAKPYEELSALLVRQNAVGIETFIDVGGHYGFYDVLVGKKNPSVRIIVFEPVPENVEIIRKNLDLNNILNAEVHQTAVADDLGQRTFQISAASDNSGILANPSTPVLKEIQVDTTSLDQFIDQIPNRPTLVKIDVEGSELLVLKGMRKLIEKIDDLRILLEFNPVCIKASQTDPREVLKTLKELDFDVYCVYDDDHRFEKLDLSIPPDTETIIGERRDINLYCLKKDRSVNICFFSHSADLAGAEWSLVEQVGGLIAKYGLPITVVLPDNGPLRQKLDDLGVSTLIIPSHIWCSIEPYTREQIDQVFLHDLKSLQGELGKIESLRPNLIVTNSMVYPWGAVAATLLNLPHIWYIHEFGRLDHELNFFLPFPQVLEIIETTSNHMLFVSLAVKNALYPNLSEEKWSVTISQITFRDRKKADLSNPFTYDGSIRFLISGRMTEAKGQGDAIFALLKCVRAGHNIELAIVGNIQTVYGNELQNYVRGENLSDRVHFIDFVENISELIATADVVLTCSKNEAFGRGTAEAMLLGKPVIGTNTGGTPELITNGKNGFLYSPGNIDELAEKMACFVDHPEMIQEFGEQASILIREKLKNQPSDEVLYQIACRNRNAKNPYSPQLLRLIFNWAKKAHESIRSEVHSLSRLIEMKDKESIELQHQLEEKYTDLAWYINHLSEAEEAINELHNQVSEASLSKAQLDAILHSRGWKLLEFFYKIRLLLAPHGSRREAILRKVYRLLKPIPRPQVVVASHVVSNPPKNRFDGQPSFSVHDLLAPPTVSIVMPVYNCLELTQQCLKSIFNAPIHNSFELIIINNSSTDGTARWLEKAAKTHKELVVINNSENLGFGGAVNQGFNRAKGKYITVINNDTIPSVGWIDRLVAVMEANQSLGVVSPITNYVGEGPQIDLEAINLQPDGVSAYGELVAKRDAKLLIVPDRLVFFCVMIRRELVDLIGGLADIYKYGNFEDDDFCLRARLAGYSLAIASNVFVYHYGTQTFKRTNISHDDYMNINREIFYERVAHFSTTLRPTSPRKNFEGEPCISVVLRTKNRPGYLNNALTSLSNQTLKDFEVVIVNDGGVDVSNLVSQFRQYFQINYMSNSESKGRTPALNAGLEAAIGKWVTYLDDDDIIYPTHLEHLLSPVLKDPKIEVSYTDANKVLCLVRDDKDLVIARKPWVPYQNFNPDDFLLDNHIPIMSFLHSKKLGIEVGKFDDGLDVLEDWDFLIRLSQATTFFHVPRITSEYRFRIDNTLGNSITRNRSNVLESMRRIFSKYPVTSPLLEKKRAENLTALEAQIETLEQINHMDIDDVQKNWLIISELTGFSPQDLHDVAFRA